jgi:multiple sugar transport system substrate-binding protein
MNVTRLGFATLLGAVALAVTACGGGGGSDNAAGTTGEEGQAAGSITVWAMGAEGDKLGALAKDFMAQNPDIKVRVTPVSWDVAHDKLITSIAGGKTPDVSLIGTTWMAEFAQTGALAQTPDSIDQSSFLPNAWKTVSVDGENYGVPWYVETRALYYRTDLAKKAGWDHAPQTWDELKQLAHDYKEKAGTAHGIALAPNNWQELIPFAWQAGSQVVSEDGTFSLDDDGMQKALAFDKSFFDEGLTPKRVPQGFDVTQGFVNGTDPMFFSGPWHLALIRDQGGAKLEGKWDVALMPKGANSRTSFLGGGDLAVFDDSDNKAAAWKFVAWLSQPDVQAKWFDMVGDLPSVKGAYDDGKLASDPHLKLFRQQLDDAEPPPVLPQWEEIAAKINDTQEKVTIGGMSPEDGANQMQQDAQSLAT